MPAAGLRVGAFASGLDHPRWLLVLPNGDVLVAVVFYLLFALGLVIFAVAPHTAPHSWGTTLTLAALFGFFTYATYDLTNWATLKDWPWKLSLVDMAWGTLVSTASAAGGKAALDWAGRN